MSEATGVRQWDMIISYNTEAQKRAILRILKGHNARIVNPHMHSVHYVRHNTHEEHKPIWAGAYLWALDLVTFKRGWRVGDQACPANGPTLAKGIVFSSTGTSAQKNATFDFLNWHLLRTMPGVYHDGFPAMACYVCDDAVLNSLATRVAMPDDVVHCAAEPKPKDPTELIQPSFFITRTTEGNPVYRNLMIDVEPGNEPRRKRMREEPTVVPFLSRYATHEGGWTVYDHAQSRHWFFEKDAREDAIELAERLHAELPANGEKDDGVEADAEAGAGEAVD